MATTAIYLCVSSLYTIAEDTLDPDDLIFPRAATRVGPKYQATVPPGPGEPPATAVSSSSMTPTTSTSSFIRTFLFS